ncbi:MAG TPA: hypothetical protein VF546_25025 [Pyrinomonadaceae bacterium]|jgi:hypothetical protein
MASLRTMNRKAIIIAASLLLALSVVAAALGIKARAQGARARVQAQALKQVHEAPEQLLRVVGNDDCPLRITEAKVKEVPGPLFTKLTGRTTDLALVSSLPDVTLVNTSGRVITRFFIIVRDPNTRKTRGVLQHDIKIQPGETYLVARDLFIPRDKVTTADAQGRTELRQVNPGLSSETAWAHFAPRADLFVTVGVVDFDNGERWQIKEGGEVR